MNPIQHSRRLAGVPARLAGLAAALVAFGATSAFATRPPPEPAPAHHPALSPWQLTGGYPVPGGVPVHPALYTVVTGGMPGWQITLIAVAAACSRRRWRCSRTGRGPAVGRRRPRPPEPFERSGPWQR
jgi:hypothetical protein